MCLAAPGKIISIENETAIVDYDGLKREANISFTECKVGDWVLVHVGFAIEKVDEEKAKSMYKLLQENE
ncbi:HypC/HybG/HupF family hydrogenase formation chaperone [Candidatus Woesearchaeota archaeon]|nr:HypC/HybG/HupF family hydrogenase formation chaperone [Nanoarchaeota archaeon]MCB9370890.1 HypC/HybG/HupF family hydrogenase formation chaperone [Candidatus Woesearchaeota archaeon]USN43991.1 MAG: HypC/HybG/HupF family hydrogenase formation chaperone [Candidatus Woesearchaeota archaeon]